jgi:hypothetical protein
VEVELPVARGRTFDADRIEIESLSGPRLSVPEGLDRSVAKAGGFAWTPRMVYRARFGRLKQQSCGSF